MVEVAATASLDSLSFRVLVFQILCSLFFFPTLSAGNHRIQWPAFPFVTLFPPSPNFGPPDTVTPSPRNPQTRRRPTRNLPPGTAPLFRRPPIPDHRRPLHNRSTLSFSACTSSVPQGFTDGLCVSSFFFSPFVVNRVPRHSTMGLRIALSTLDTPTLYPSIL